MTDLSVEVGHSNGAYYKVSHWLIILINRTIFFRHMCMMWMQLELTSNTIKSNSFDIKIELMQWILFYSFFPPTKIPFSENRIRFPPEVVDLKKLSPGDPCEVWMIINFKS